MRYDRVGAGLNVKFQLLHDATPSRLGEVVVSSAVHKPTGTVKATEETEEYVPSKRMRGNLRNRP